MALSVGLALSMSFVQPQEPPLWRRASFTTGLEWNDISCCCTFNTTSRITSTAPASRQQHQFSPREISSVVSPTPPGSRLRRSLHMDLLPFSCLPISLHLSATCTSCTSSSSHIFVGLSYLRLLSPPPVPLPLQSPVGVVVPSSVS